MSLAVIISTLLSSFLMKNTDKYLPLSVMPSALYKCSPSTLPVSFLKILQCPASTSSTSFGRTRCFHANFSIIASSHIISSITNTFHLILLSARIPRGQALKNQGKGLVAGGTPRGRWWKSSFFCHFVSQAKPSIPCLIVHESLKQPRLPNYIFQSFFFLPPPLGLEEVIHVN